MKKYHSPVECVSLRTDSNNKRRRINGRQQQQLPPRHSSSTNAAAACWMDCESIESIHCLSSTITNSDHPSTESIINSPMASSTTTEIFLDRLQKEILVPFRYSLSSQVRLLDTDQSIHDAIDRRIIIQQRILCGYNNVSKLLFEYAAAKSATKNKGVVDLPPSIKIPLLVVLVNPENYDDQSDSQQSIRTMSSASMLQHVPLLAHEMNVPLLLLPSSVRGRTKSSGSNTTSRGNGRHSKVEDLTTVSTIHVLSDLFGCNNNKKHILVIAFTENAPQKGIGDSVTSSMAMDSSDDAKSGIDQSSNDILKTIHNSINSFINYIKGKI